MESRRPDSFADLVGLRILDVGEGYAKVSLRVENHHTNALGVTHGGALFTIADYAFARAANFGQREAVAIQVSINFLNPSHRGDVLTAEATRVSESKRIGLYSVRVVNEEGKMIAPFSGTAYIKSFEDTAI